MSTLVNRVYLRCYCTGVSVENDPEIGHFRGKPVRHSIYLMQTFANFCHWLNVNGADQAND